MKVVHIKINKISIKTVLNCEIHMEANSHGSAKVVGIIDENSEESCMNTITSNSWFTIIGSDENRKEKNLFAGVIYESSLNNENGLLILTIELVGGTALMDVTKNTRTFQNTGLSYDSLYGIIDESYGAKHILYSGSGSIGNFTIQYGETDWEFIKRMAANRNTCILPSYKNESLQYYVGVPGGSSTGVDLNVTEYTIKKVLNDYYYKKSEESKAVGAINTLAYTFENREFLSLGSSVIINNRKLYIYKVDSTYVGGELVNKYEGRNINGFKVDKYNNYKIVGASIEGSVQAVSKEKVQVSLGTDVAGASIWFNYATVYSSPDGAGWYCMPEVSDSVRVYFPSEDGNDAYAINSVHVNGNDRSDPSKKFIKNKSNKQIEITNSSLKITNNKGMTIKLDDNEGISIISDKNILLEGKNDVQIISDTKSVILQAPESIKLKQGNTTLKLNKEISLEGSEVKLQ